MTLEYFFSPKTVQKFAYSLLWASAALVILPIVLIIGIMFYKGFAALNLGMFSLGTEGLVAPIVGTVLLVALTALVSAPLGIASAIYLNEYATKGPLVNTIRLAIINLAGVPSVVYGLFGLAVFVMLMKLDRCLLAGALTLALLILPVIIRTAEEALRTVPLELRQGSWALGATRWQTIRRIVLPNAFPGIITGLILSIGRAAGETAPILFTAAFFSLTDPYPDGLLDPILVLPYNLYVMATEAPDVTEEMKWATALVLVLLVLFLNLAAIFVRARLRRAHRW
ncbi:MAG: phosphate ABC transporter permease PstA [Armatimonadota bacterium]